MSAREEIGHTGPVNGQAEKLVYGGDGLVRLATGEVVFVPFVVPGEAVTLQPGPKRQKVRRGSIQRIDRSSPDRVEAPCQVFGRCGGCQWQHLSISAQRHWKREIVRESLSRIGKLPDVPVSPVIPASDESAWGYRNKVEWHVTRQNGQWGLGYEAAGSHDTVVFPHCPIIPEELNRLAQWITAHPDPLEGLNRITARLNPGQELLLLLHGKADSVSEAWLSALQKAFPGLQGVMVREHQDITQLAGNAYLTQTLEGIAFQVSAESFFQVHTSVAAEMTAYIRALLDRPIPVLLDLYAGVGLFSLALRDKAEQVIAVENAPGAIADLLDNIHRNGLEGIGVLQADTQAVLPELPDEVHTAIVDPPRSGCPPALIDWLAQQVSHQVVYVSCDPATLARDLARFCQAGWRIDQVQPFDMFPQTYHVETVVSLVR